MFEWVNAYTSLLTLVVQAFTLAVLAWTLWWLRRYTLAAEEQVEASQKPFLTVTWERLTDHQTAVEIQKSDWEQRRPRLGKVPSDGFKIYSIGSGPALNVSCQLLSAQNKKKLRYAPWFPHLPPSEESLQTDIGPSVLYGTINRSALEESENLEFVIEYNSLRGVSYQTVISIHREGLTEDELGQPSDSGSFTWVITGVQMNRIPLVR